MTPQLCIFNTLNTTFNQRPYCATLDSNLGTQPGFVLSGLRPCGTAGPPTGPTCPPASPGWPGPPGSALTDPHHTCRRRKCRRDQTLGVETYKSTTFTAFLNLPSNISWKIASLMLALVGLICECEPSDYTMPSNRFDAALPGSL